LLLTITLLFAPTRCCALYVRTDAVGAHYFPPAAGWTRPSILDMLPAMDAR
jgi:hypothetical protein